MAIKFFKGWKIDNDTYKVQDERVDNLGTASTKNSTSVVTDSSDLVESGAVYNALVDGEVMLPQNLFINAVPRTVEVNGITFVITKDSVNMSGRYTSVVSQPINAGRGVNECLYLPFGEYVVTTSVNDSNTEIFIGGTYNNAFKQLTDSGNFVEFTLDENTQSDFIVDGTVGIAIYVKAISNGVTINTTIYPRIYKKSEYHIPLKDVVPQKCDNSVIGTVEDGTTASKAWSKGEHFIKDGQFKEVTQAIASGGAINDSNTVDKPIADCLVKQATFSGTTSSVGTLIPLYNGSDRIILGFKLDTSLVTMMPCKNGDGTAINAVVAGSDLKPVPNYAVSGTYYYI